MAGVGVGNGVGGECGTKVRGCCRDEEEEGHGGAALRAIWTESPHGHATMTVAAICITTFVPPWVVWLSGLSASL